MSTQWGSSAGLTWFLLLLCLMASPHAGAQTKPSAEPIVDKRTQRLLESIPGSATDLPPYLKTSQDAYLLITAGASYTNIQLLENPEVSPQKVASMLAKALAGTSLHGETVKWSADRYAAAQVFVRHNHFGSVRGTNVVPIAALLTNLRQSGLIPHLLLRVANHARISLVTHSYYGSRTFRWFDAARLGNPASVTITGRITWLSFARILAYYLVSPLVCLLGLGLAQLISRSQKPIPFVLFTPGRTVFSRISSSAVIGAMLIQVAGMVFLLQTPTPAALADLWFGSSTTSLLVPFLALGIVPVALFLLLARRQEIKLFGPVPIGPAIPMSDEEKAVRKRVAQYTMVPHLVGAVVLGSVPFLVSRTSPLYPIIHPLAAVMPILGGSLVALIFRKQLGKFTRKTLDDDLTWRARQLGQTLGVRLPDVFVEDSSRAAHLAFATHQGHHITLSRKLQQTFTSAEMDFVLASHLASMKRKAGSGPVLLILLLSPVLALPALLLARNVPSLSGPVLIMSSSWFIPAMLIYLLIFAALTPVITKVSTSRQIEQETDADKAALEVTGNLAAADGALSKLDAGAEVATLRSGNTLASEMGHRAEAVMAARLLLRRAALQKTAQEMQIASVPRT